MGSATILLLALAIAPADSARKAMEAVKAGRYDEAHALALEAAAEFGRQGDLKSQSRAINTAGNARYVAGNYDSARELYLQALDLARRGGDEEGVVLRLLNIGSIAYTRGRYGEAENWYQQADAECGRHTGAPWATEAEWTISVNQATLLQRLGRENEALAVYRSLLPSLDRNPPLYAGQLLTNLGSLYRRLGDPYKAREFYNRALQKFEKDRNVDRISGAVKNVAIAEAVEFKNYGVARRLFERVKVLAGKVSNKREALLAELYLAELDFLEHKPDEARERWRKTRSDAVALGTVEEEWRALYGLSRVSDRLAMLRQAVARIEAIRERTTRGPQRGEFLADKRDVYDALIGALLDHEKKPSDELLRTIEQARARTIADETFGWTVAKLEESLENDEALAVQWHSPDREAWVIIDRDGARVASTAPGGAGRRWTVVPDGPLERERLTTDNVVFLPTLRLWKKRREQTRLASGAAFAVTVAQGGLPALAAAPDEARFVAHALSVPWQVYLDQEATAKRFQESLASANLVHIAAHAVPDAAQPRLSRLMLTDSPVTLGEIEKLPLKHVELVTLSACQTATGRAVRGEGVESMAAGLLRAGVRAVVASLAPVDDRAAAEFMKQFYAILGSGGTAREAMAQARERMRNSAWRDARYWMPWVLIGDGDFRAADPPRTWLLIALAAISATAAIVAFLQRSVAK